MHSIMLSILHYTAMIRNDQQCSAMMSIKILRLIYSLSTLYVLTLISEGAKSSSDGGLLPPLEKWTWVAGKPRFSSSSGLSWSSAVTALGGSMSTSMWILIGDDFCFCWTWTLLELFLESLDGFTERWLVWMSKYCFSVSFGAEIQKDLISVILRIWKFASII